VPLASEQLCEYDECQIAKEVIDRLEPLLFLYPDVLALTEVILNYVGVWGLYFYFANAKSEDLR
jgi:hypothetical protein